MVHPVPKSSPRVRCSCKTTEGLVALANFDADKEKELPEKYEVPGDFISTWMRMKLGVYVPTLTTEDKGYDVLSAEYTLFLRILDSTEALSI
ncbi:hypothetical protein WN943_018579 [Citrus x changshan-huyou]